MGKWTSLKKKYPAAPLDGDYQAKVEAVKHEYQTNGTCETDETLKNQYVVLRNSKTRIQEALAQINAEITACEQLFIERFEGRGTTNQKFEDGLMLYLKDDPSFVVTDPDDFYTWVRSDQANLAEFPLTVHSATIQARCKGRLENGDPLPPGTEIGFVKTSIGAKGLPKA